MLIKQRVSRLVEGIEIIRRLWTEDHVTHEGRYWQLDDVTIRAQPLNKASPPILIGVQVEASIKRAAEIFRWLVYCAQCFDGQTSC